MRTRSGWLSGPTGSNTSVPEFDPTRYACQARLPAWDGPRGQAKLAAATAVVVGVGATGSVIAEALVRAGVGHVRLIDRDVLELSNLQRQSLYDEDDLASGLPKAEAARRRLARINSEVSLDARVSDLTARNAGELLEGADVVLDGTDNFVTRFVINDACARAGVPWVYAGVVGTTVHGFPIVPGGACFRCYLPSPPPPGTTETCQTAGVIGPAVQIAGGLAATEGLKLLLGLVDEVASGLFVMDVWTRDARRVGLQRDPSCATCAGQYPALEADEAGGHAELCWAGMHGGGVCQCHGRVLLGTTDMRGGEGGGQELPEWLCRRAGRTELRGPSVHGRRVCGRERCLL